MYNQREPRIIACEIIVYCPQGGDLADKSLTTDVGVPGSPLCVISPIHHGSP